MQNCQKLSENKNFRKLNKPLKLTINNRSITIKSCAGTARYISTLQICLKILITRHHSQYKRIQTVLKTYSSLAPNPNWRVLALACTILYKKY